jgi:hypothetical protein
VQAEAKKASPASDNLYESLSPHMLGMDRDSFSGLMDKFSPEMLHALDKALVQKAKEAEKAATRKHIMSQAPELPEVELNLENKLAGTMNPAYQKQTWHQRTRSFSFEWDQTRRRRMGVLTTYFNSFTPRWDRPDWRDFNLAGVRRTPGGPTIWIG